MSTGSTLGTAKPERMAVEFVRHKPNSRVWFAADGAVFDQVAELIRDHCAAAMLLAELLHRPRKVRRSVLHDLVDVRK